MSWWASTDLAEPFLLRWAWAVAGDPVHPDASSVFSWTTSVNLVRGGEVEPGLLGTGSDSAVLSSTCLALCALPRCPIPRLSKERERERERGKEAERGS